MRYEVHGGVNVYAELDLTGMKSRGASALSAAVRVSARRPQGQDTSPAPVYRGAAQSRSARWCHHGSPLAIDPIWYVVGAYAAGALVVALIVAKLFKR